jgi:ubiquinone/menaquinone biosynthesis C-methylase UbiE
MDQDKIKQEERDWQDRLGGSLQEDSYRRPGTQVVLCNQFSRIAQALELQPGMKVLDAGCGVGHLLEWLNREYPADYSGIDLSPKSIEAARARNAGFHLSVGDAEALPYENESFDRVVCNGAAHHFLDFKSALKEIFRVLKPSGKAVLYEPVGTPLTNAVRHALLTSDKYESPADLEQKHEFTRETIRATFLETGFANVVSTFHDFLAYPLTGMYIELPPSRWKCVMQFLVRVENQLDRCFFLRPLFNLVSWRLLVVASKPCRRN